jgi:hypothetical protein
LRESKARDVPENKHILAHNHSIGLRSGRILERRNLCSSARPTRSTKAPPMRVQRWELLLLSGLVASAADTFWF